MADDGEVPEDGVLFLKQVINDQQHQRSSNNGENPHTVSLSPSGNML